MALTVVPSILQAIMDRVAVFRYLTTLRGEIEARLAAAEVLVPAKKTVTVVFGDLAAGNSNGAAVAVNIGTTLPANARILSTNVKLATPFTGGSASAVTCDIGSTGDADAIVAAANVFAAAVDGQASSRPLGIAPNKHFSTATQLKATFTPDAGHQLANLTAGACTVEVFYFVAA